MNRDNFCDTMQPLVLLLNIGLDFNYILTDGIMEQYHWRSLNIDPSMDCQSKFDGDLHRERVNIRSPTKEPSDIKPF